MNRLIEHLETDVLPFMCVECRPMVERLISDLQAPESNPLDIWMRESDRKHFEEVSARKKAMREKRKEGRI